MTALKLEISPGPRMPERLCMYAVATLSFRSGLRQILRCSPAVWISRYGWFQRVEENRANWLREVLRPYRQLEMHSPTCSKDKYGRFRCKTPVLSQNRYCTRGEACLRCSGRRTAKRSHLSAIVVTTALSACTSRRRRRSGIWIPGQTLTVIQPGGPQGKELPF